MSASDRARENSSMNKSKTRPAEIVDLQLPDRNLSLHETSTLVQTSDFRVIQLRLPAGSVLPTYEAHGQIILHCLEGHIRVRFDGEEHELNAHQLLFLTTNSPFGIAAIEHSSLIATIVSPTDRRQDVIGNTVID